MIRSLSAKEMAFIALVAQKLSNTEGSRLLADAEIARVVSANADSSRIQFSIPGYQRPDYKGQHSFGVEGKMLDGDGVELSVLLHADENGRLLELEFIRWGGGDLVGPEWNTLKLY